MAPNSKDQVYMRYECINFECQLKPTGFYLEGTLKDEIDHRPICQHCGAAMVREDEMATNALLWELRIEVEGD